MEKLMIEYDGNHVPIELCTVDREGGADDCDTCADACKRVMDTEDCNVCPIQICFNKLAFYERIHEQVEEIIKSGKLKPEEYQWIIDLYNKEKGDLS